MNLIDLTKFIQSDWQQRPVILRGALSDFINPIEPDELAGLATEDFVESRVIFHDSDVWSAESGPFSDYDKYGQEKWTLVVQSVNHWHEPTQTFADLFRQLPMWQFDDVMVSYACDGGGVGPHRDRYDTFICQGSGKRRWRVGDKNAVISDVVAHEKLLHVTAFEPIIDEVIETGDILYIPAGFPHEGVSLGESMSFSVGLQSINSTQLLSDFADYLIDAQSNNNTLRPALYQHMDKSVRTPVNTLTSKDIDGLQTFLQSAMTDKGMMAQFFAQYLTEARHELDMPPVEDIEPINTETLRAELAHTPLIKTNGLKCLHVEGQYHVIFINGEAYPLSQPDADFVMLICGQSEIHANDVPKAHIDAHIDLICEWVNLGFYYFDYSR